MIAITICGRRIRGKKDNHVIRYGRLAGVEKGRYLRVGRTTTVASTFPEKLGNCS